MDVFPDVHKSVVAIETLLPERMTAPSLTTC